MQAVEASAESLVCAERSWAHRLGCTHGHPRNQRGTIIPANWAGPWEIGKGQGRGPSLECLVLLSARRDLGRLRGTERTLSIELTHRGEY